MFLITCKIMEARAVARSRMIRAVTEGAQFSDLKSSPVKSRRSRRTSDCGINGNSSEPEE